MLEQPVAEELPQHTFHHRPQRPVPAREAGRPDSQQLLQVALDEPEKRRVTRSPRLVDTSAHTKSTQPSSRSFPPRPRGSTVGSPHAGREDPQARNCRSHEPPRPGRHQLHDRPQGRTGHGVRGWAGRGNPPVSTASSRPPRSFPLRGSAAHGAARPSASWPPSGDCPRSTSTRSGKPIDLCNLYARGGRVCPNCSIRRLQ